MGVKALVEIRAATPPHPLIADVDAFSVDRLLTRTGRGVFAFGVVRGIRRGVLEEGRIVVISSTTNVMPYVGVITHMEEDAGAGTIEVSGDNYASVLYGLALDNTAPQGNTGAGKIAGHLLQMAQGSGRSVFLQDGTQTGATLNGEIDFGAQLLGSALDALAQRVNEEWWIEHLVTRQTLTHVLRWGYRGHTRNDILLQEGVHFTAAEYKRDAIGSPRSATAVGGGGPIALRQSVVVAQNPGGASSQAVQVNPLAQPGLLAPPAPLLARDVIELRPLDDDASILADVARRAFERSVVSNESLSMTAKLTVCHRFSPGDTIRARFHSVNFGGLDRMVRINAMQPDEDSGECDLDVEVV